LKQFKVFGVPILGGELSISMGSLKEIHLYFDASYIYQDLNLGMMEIYEQPPPLCQIDQEDAPITCQYYPLMYRYTSGILTPTPISKYPR